MLARVAMISASAGGDIASRLTPAALAATAYANRFLSSFAASRVDSRIWGEFSCLDSRWSIALLAVVRMLTGDKTSPRPVLQAGSLTLFHSAVNGKPMFVSYHNRNVPSR